MKQKTKREKIQTDLSLVIFVEQGVSANVCMLSTQSSVQGITDEASQYVTLPRIHELDIDDTRLPEVQAIDHAEHVWIAFSKHKRKEEKTILKIKTKTNEEQANLIDKNTMLLAEKTKALRRRKVIEQKAQWAEVGTSKRRRVTFGKYNVKKVDPSEKSLLLWFDRQGGKRGCVHTHTWRGIV